MLSRRGDRGEGALSYVAIVLLVGTIVAATVVVALPDTVVARIRASVCHAAGGENCDRGDGGASPSATPSSSPQPSPGVTNTPAGNGETPEEREYRAARDAATQADQEAQRLENEWNDFSLLKEIGKLGLDFIAGDIIACIENPNLGDCLWALVGLVPWGKIGKLLKSIPKVIKLIDRFLDLKRRLDKARKARKDARDRLDRAEEACELSNRQPNSFVPGTRVLMADGTRRPIEDVDVGDTIWASDPESGRSGPRRVIRHIVGSGPKELVDLTVDLDGRLGGATARITATANHPFWVDGGTDDWIDGGRLVFGDTLVTPDGRRAMVVGHRRHSRAQRVHNLTVDGIPTFFVAAGERDVLVHNCRDLDLHEEPTNRPPGHRPDPLKLGHTLQDHVDASPERLRAHAQDPRNTRGVAGKWADRATAESAINAALDDPKNAKKIQNWLQRKGPHGSSDRFPISYQIGPNGAPPLGKVMYRNGDFVDSSNRFTVILQRSKGHSPGWYVYTAYPEP
ncbi:RNase A-like domain-containing protein [Actinomadura sp. 21ATH]|uniref:RNase A-like domain-containing protein n=1 Tax=Actinomadura sp. 21ATH TaxID=1735444 RepID=UPI0035C09593